MKKDLGVKAYLFPMPVLMVATYGEGDTVDVMNVAWGGMYASNQVVLDIGASHKTAKNLKERGAFTVSLADVAHLEEADFFGIASGNTMADKFARSGLHAVKSSRVDAPIVEEFPLTLECRVAEILPGDGALHVVGEIVNVCADEKVLDAEGKVDPAKLNAFVFDPFQSGYYKVGEKVGQAWSSGKKFMD